MTADKLHGHFLAILRTFKREESSRWVAAKISRFLSHKTVDGWLREDRVPDPWAMDLLIKRIEKVYRQVISHEGAAGKWASVDWSLGNKEIGNRMGVTTQHAGRQRSIYAPETQDRATAKRVDWSGVDWADGDKQIAQALGVDRGTVRTMRLRRQGMVNTPKLRRVIPWHTVDWQKRDIEIATELRVTHGQVWIRRRLEQNRKDRKA